MRRVLVRTQESTGGNANVAAWVLGSVWNLLRVPFAVLLLALEPLVRITLVGFALLLAFVVVLLKLAGPPGFTLPFWTLLMASGACIALLWGYHTVLRFLAR
jgi:ABC-type methionine transport system permease subunit